MDQLVSRPAVRAQRIDVARLERDYYEHTVDGADPTKRVAFGTSGHRGTPFDGSFTEAHILAITQAICEHRAAAGIAGPLYMGKDTHGVSSAAERTALEVLAANSVQVIIQADDGYTPTPVISRAILARNLANRTGGSGTRGVADGIIITPSHNPPQDGGFKYNAPDGGPADTQVTRWIQDRANELLLTARRGIKRIPYERALTAPTTRLQNLVTPYVTELANTIDFDAIRGAGVRIGVDPMGGASLAYWRPIAERYGLELTVVNQVVDPSFSFMPPDHDGKIRMDCSSTAAMAALVGLKDRFDIAFGNDPDADRHGIVTRSAGLMNPNHYLAVAIRYLLHSRPRWPAGAVVGKTLVSSAIIDRVVRSVGRRLMEVPVGFKWFTPGLFDGSCCFGGEESAGATFLQRDGAVWTTDKDGILLGLLAAEITAVTGKDPGELYAAITAQLGAPVYVRIDTPCTPEEKAGFKRLTPESVTAANLAGDPIELKLTVAPGNGAPIGGLKVTTGNGWFAARPSGTENVYKLYAESFRDRAHLDLIVAEAREVLEKALSQGRASSGR